MATADRKIAASRVARLVALGLPIFQAQVRPQWPDPTAWMDLFGGRLSGGGRCRVELPEEHLETMNHLAVAHGVPLIAVFRAVLAYGLTAEGA